MLTPPGVVVVAPVCFDVAAVLLAAAPWVVEDDEHAPTSRKSTTNGACRGLIPTNVMMPDRWATLRQRRLRGTASGWQTAELSGAA